MDSADRPAARSTLVVGHDRHPAATAALGVAIGLAHRLGAELHVLHSVTLDDYGIDPDDEQFEAECERICAAERAQVTAAVQDAGLIWSYHQARGDPAEALTRLAEELDAACIVVGATRQHALPHFAGGDSVARRLLRRQKRPVLVVPDPDQP